MSVRPPAETETESDMTDAPAVSDPEDHRAAADYGNGVAALRALREYEPQNDGERVVVEAVRSLAQTVVTVNRRMNQGFIDLRRDLFGHIDGVVEELRTGVAGVAATQNKLTASADSVQELLGIVRGLDAYVRGLPTDRPSSPETPSAKHRVSAVTAIEPDSEGASGVGDDP